MLHFLHKSKKERDFKEENRIMLIKQRNEIMKRYPKIVYEYIHYTQILENIDKELGIEGKPITDVRLNDRRTD